MAFQILSINTKDSPYTKLKEMKKCILIVDDSESIREVVSSALIEKGFEVIQGVDGKDGLENLYKRANDVHLILSDLNMPNMDGIQLVKEVRKNEKFKYLPILILTTESQTAKKMEAKQAGATGWIIKPFEKEKLLNIINKVMR